MLSQRRILNEQEESSETSERESSENKSNSSRSSGVNLGFKLYLMSFNDLSITSKSSGRQKTFPKFGPLTPIAKLCCSYLLVYGSKECL